MGFLNRKYETPKHYKPINKAGQNGLFYATIGIIIAALLYVLSFYILE
jgi:hypothetical protein